MQTAMRFGLCLFLSIAAVLSCKNGTNTAGLLDAAFVTSFKLYMSVPGDVIYDGKDFDAKLEAKPSLTSLPLKSINGNVTWTLTGGGTLTFVSCPAMQEGGQTCRLRYSGGLTAGQTKVIKLQAIHNDSKETVSEGFTVATQTFSVSVPTRINANSVFTATITATDPTGNTNTSYNGTVIPYLALVPGRPNVEEISNFVNGVASVQMQIHKPAYQMQLVVYDKVNAAFSGTSNTFRVIQTDTNFAALDLIAVPLSPTSNRLSWTHLDNTVVNQYRIYRKDVNGVHQLIFTEATTTKSYYVDASLTTGTNYDYKVEAVNAGSSVISTDFASSIPKACTPVSSSPSGYTVWTKAQSPYCGSITLSLSGALIIEAGVVILWNGGSAWVANGQLIKAIGTPNERIIITSSSATPVAGHFPGFGVTSAAGTVIDGSGNYVGGSIFKYTLFEYGVGAYWQSPIYYFSWMFRYMNGLLVFENVSTLLDGGTYARNSISIQPKGSSKVQINNMIFYRNTSIAAGAIHLKSDGSGAYDLKLTGNYFALNTASAGTYPAGGAFTVHPNGGAGVTTGPFQISDNQFLGNNSQSAGYNGGALLLATGGSPSFQIYNNTFSDNAAVNGGAISFETAGSTSVSITNNQFTNNAATTNGGAIRIGSGANAFTITNNQFVTNTATAGKNFFNGIAQNHSLQNGYWDGVTDSTCAAPQRLALGIADTCGGGGSGTVNLTGVTATQYPLCINDPTVSGCVGAR